MKNDTSGRFIVSLDFELFWGMKGIKLLDKAINDLFNNRLMIRKGPDESRLWYHPTISEYVFNRIFNKVK